MVQDLVGFAWLTSLGEYKGVASKESKPIVKVDASESSVRYSVFGIVVLIVD